MLSLSFVEMRWALDGVSSRLPPFLIPFSTFAIYIGDCKRRNHIEELAFLLFIEG